MMNIFKSVEFLNITSRIVMRVIDRILPKKMSEKEKKELKIKEEEIKKEVQEVINTYNYSQDADFRNFILEYEGKPNNIAIEFIRSIVRPVLTFAFSGLYIYVWLHPDNYSPEQISALSNITKLILGFWFGSRFIEKLVINFKKK